MNTKWHGQSRSPENRSEIHFQNQTHRVQLRYRIDVFLIGGVLVSLCLVVSVWALGIEFGNRLSLFDGPLIQPIRDERILINVRDDIDKYPLLDAVMHTPDNRVYIAQEDGIFHRYNPATELWSSTKPFSANDPINNTFVMLRSGCGIDPISDFAGDCPDNESLWAITADGGLARRANGRWQILVSDTTFVGVSGRPIESNQLTAAAVSPDNEWLVVGTQSDGVGIYNIEHRQWLQNGENLFINLPSPKVTHIVWWQGRFWVGGPSGLISLEMEKNIPNLIEIPNTRNTVLDLDADLNGDLWILEQTQCEESGNNCLRLSRLEYPSQEPLIMLDERNIFHDLSLTDLNFAQYWDNQLVVTGKTGIFSYDVLHHSWKHHFDNSVTATLPLPDGDGFYFGFAGGIGLFKVDSFEVWELPDKKIVKKILPGAEQEVLALTIGGNVFAINSSGEVSPVFERDGTALAPENFTAAVAAGETVIFINPTEGALIHNISTRSYKDIAVDLLPDWLRQPDLRLINSGDHIYALSAITSNDIKVYILPADKMATTNYFNNDINAVSPIILPGPMQSMWNWNHNGIGLIAGDGRVYHIIPNNNPERLTGSKQSDLDNLPMLDVTAVDQGLVIATRKGIRRYNSNTRAWSDFIVPSVEADVVEIGFFDGHILGRTDLGQLIQIGGSNSIHIGDVTGFKITDNGLSDAQLIDRQLYLAGQGLIEQYDFDSRQVTDQWELPGDESVELKGVINKQPLALSDGIATLGDSVIDGVAGPVVNLSVTGGYIWTVRQSGEQPYIKGYPIDSPFDSDAASCFFRNPSMGEEVTRIVDARSLLNGIIATVTNAGLRFYNPSARSWFAGPTETLPENSRLYVLSGHLILAEETRQGSRLSFIPLESIEIPHTCSTKSILFERETVSVKAFSVDESSGRVAWLLQDGSIRDWQAGEQTEILPASTDGPSSLELYRVYGRSDYLLFSGGNSIWHYDLSNRKWKQITLEFDRPVESILNLNIEGHDGHETVTVRTKEGTFYLGTFDPQDSHISVKLIFNPTQDSFNASADSLLDVQAAGNKWVFVLDDGIKYFDPAKRSWSPKVDLPGPDRSLSYRQVFERRVIVADDGQVWWVAQDKGVLPSSFVKYQHQADETTALDGEGTIWRLTADTALLKCPIPEDSNHYDECHRYNPAPFVLDPDSVNQAFVWQDIILFDTDMGLRAFDSSLGLEVILPAEATDFTAVTEVRGFEERLWLHNSESLLMLRRGERDKFESQLFSGVTEFIYDSANRLWARFDGGWQVWQDTEFQPPYTTNDSQFEEAGLKLFVINGANVSGIDRAGYPYRWQEQPIKDGLKLPPQINVDAITALLPGIERDWWVLSGSGLDHVVVKVCVYSTDPGVDMEGAPNAVTLSLKGLFSNVFGTAAPPETIPCLLIEDSFELGLDFEVPDAAAILSADINDDGNLKIVKTDRTTLWVRSGLVTGYYVEIEPAPLLDYGQTQFEGLLTNQWGNLRKNIVSLPNDAWAYDPFILLASNEQGQLIASRPSGRNVELASKGLTQPELPPALDKNWLRWDRSQESFIVGIADEMEVETEKLGKSTLDTVIEFFSGLFGGSSDDDVVVPEDVPPPLVTVTIPKNEFIVDNHLLFEEVGAILAKRQNRVFVANQAGVWAHNRSDLNLNDPTIRYQPINLSGSIEAAHNRFMTGQGDLVLGENQIQPATPDHIVQFGDVTITEKIREQEMTAVVAIGGIEFAAFTEQGFIWDTGRQGLAYTDEDLLLQSKAGIHPVDRLADFDPGPNGSALQEDGLLQSESGIGLFFFKNGIWYKHDTVDWITDVKNPITNRDLIRNNTWTWTLQDGKLDVRLADPVHDFSFQVSEDGYSFSSDRLLSAAGHDGRLYVMTKAFFEIANEPDELANLTASRLPPILTDRLEDIKFADGTSYLFHRYSDTVSRWDSGSNQLVQVSPSENPYRQRLLVDTDRLRFTGFSEQVIKELKVDQVTGGDEWVLFDFVDSRFPFDIVTSFATLGSQLYIGTDVGLQVYSGNLSTGINDISNIYDLRGQGEVSLAVVSKVGVPSVDPNVVIARSDAACIEQLNGSTFSPCRDPGLLDQRLRAETDLWRWITDSTDKLTGNYKDNRGQIVPTRIRITEGRFPHDKLQDVAVCNGQAFSMWQSDWITVYPDDTIRLSPGLQNYPLAEMEPRRFICVERDVYLTEKLTLSSGLYFEGQDRRMWRWESQWDEQKNSTLKTALRERADRPPIVNRERLRLLPPLVNGSFTFEQRMLDGNWQSVPWYSGRVAVDEWRELLFGDNRFWAATPAGVVSFSRGVNAKAELEADSVMVVREPSDSNGICEITDFGLEDDTVWVRCDADGSKVYHGRLDGQQDTSVFKSFDGVDPFARQELVTEEATGFWQWHLTGKEGGEPGTLVGELRQEKIEIIGGKFQFDTINSIALFEPNKMEIGTEAGGWFQTPQESFHLRDWHHPEASGIDPVTVDGVSITRVGEEQRLCLHQTIGNYLRLAPTGDPEPLERCLEYLGDDMLWRYMKDGDLLSIRAKNSTGDSNNMGRRLEAGRFADDVVIGPPVVGEHTEGIFYLLPTQAGVVHIDQSNRKTNIHVPSFPGLPGDSPPRALLLLDPETPVYVTRNGFQNLENREPVVPNISLDVPPDAVIRTAEAGSQDFVRIRWIAEGQWGWTSVKKDDLSTSIHNSLQINVGNFDKFIEHQILWNNPRPWMDLTFEPAGIDAFWTGSSNSYRTNYPSSFELLAPILVENRLLLVGKHDLQEINLEHVMVEAFALTQ